MSEPSTRREATPLELIKALGLWDLVWMNIVAVVGLRWITRGARVGAPSVLLWLLACVTFFLPLAAALAELSSRYPEQGGPYAWARRAFGPLHGFICGWCLWVNNLFYFPSLLLFAAANAVTVFGDRFTDLADERTYSVVFVLVGLWLAIGINILGFGVGRWLQNLGALVTWLPAALLIGAGAVAFATFGSATSFAPADLLPRDDVLATLGLWSAMCFAFSGFEIGSYVGQEVRDARRTIPLAVLLGGAGVAVIYIAGSMSVLVAVPAEALAERSGIADAVDVVSSRVGLAGLGGLTGLLLAVGSFAGTSSWVAGAARVPFAAGIDRALPPALGRLHPRYKTPHVALVVQGLASTAIFLSSVFLTVTGAESTVQEAYDIMVNLTILVYFIPYVYLFASLLALRRGADLSDRAVLWVPGGRTGVWVVGLVGMASTGISIGLVFVPPLGTENALNFHANLLWQAAAVLGVGLAFYFAGGSRGSSRRVSN